MKTFLKAFWKYITAQAFIVLLAVMYALGTLLVLLTNWGEVHTYTTGWRHLLVFVILAAYFRAGVVYARKGVNRG